MYQKCLILCSTILHVLHNASLTLWLLWKHSGFQTSLIFTSFLATFGNHFHIYKWCLMCMIQQGYKFASLSLWPLTFFELKIKWNQVSRDWKRVSCHGNITFYNGRCVSCSIISLSSFNGLCCKLAKKALFIHMKKFLGWVYDIISQPTCMFYTFFKLKYLRN